MDTIRHTTPTTNQVRQPFWSKVGDELIEVCTGLIRQITMGETVSLPWPPGYSLNGQAVDRCLVAVVWANGLPSQAVATIGVVAADRGAATVWRQLHRLGETPVVTDPKGCADAPWVATAHDADIVRHMNAVEWLGDFERCLAWAWLAEQGMGDEHP
jgi:hypothetical protein